MVELFTANLKLERHFICDPSGVGSVLGFDFLQICDPFRVVRFLISGVFYRSKH